MTDTTPIATQERIGEVDIIRGFALFGVLWMNVLGMGDFVVPSDKIHGLTQFETLEKIVGFWSHFLMSGKAQALFSILFGFGFAVMMDRISQRGGDGVSIYLRRLTILLLIGIAHVCLLWTGDILNAYAAMGFLLLLTRKWSSRWLVIGAVVLTVVVPMALLAYYRFTTPDGQPPAFVIAMETAAERNWPIVMGHDYPAFVVAMFRTTFTDFYTQPLAISYLSWILGRFLIGSWIYRQGWLQNPQRHLLGFAVVASVCLPIGLLLSIRGMIMKSLELKAYHWSAPILQGSNTLAEVSLALGYGAAIVLLCQLPAVRRVLSGLGDVGRMALTNYLTHSLFFVFVLYGFGLGWLPWMGPTFALAFSVVLFSAQIVFSRWWLSRFAYGPAEYLWRWGTYGKKPVMKLATAQS